LPLLILYVYLANQFAFALLIVLVSVLALHEFLRMSLPQERLWERSLALVVGGGLTLAVSFASPQGTLAALVLSCLLFATWFLFRFQDIKTVVLHFSLVLLGLLYIPVLLGHMALLHGLPHGKAWIFFIMFLVMTSDSAAYFSGIRFGKHKLYPAISPNKSIEGAIGGLFGGVLAALIVRSCFFPALDLLDCVALGFALGAISQIGDLFESMLKRSFEVKDSGGLIPGHGGLLDRLDSLLFAYPLAYYYALYLF